MRPLVFVLLSVVLGRAFAAPNATAPRAVESDKAMVVSAQHLASEVGAQVLRRGGNAVDAAVAVGYALAVTHPCCGNLGGGGFMVIRFKDGRSTFINFREKAPLAARADMYLDAAGQPIAARSLQGYLAVGVPGTVMGLENAREKYGTRSRAELLAPALALAQKGFILTAGDAQVLAGATAAFQPQANIARVFLKNGAALAAGDRLVQPQLARTLREIRADGVAAFYQGPIARAVVEASRRNGGILTLEDFAAYTVTESAPVSCTYRGYSLLSAPPPSSGGVTLCEMLKILEAYPLKALGFHTGASIHFMTEAMRFAYHDRNLYLGDPAFVANPVDRLISEANAATIRSRIDAHRATPSATLGTLPVAEEHATTTHYSVVDAAGNAVAVTFTINDDFGAKVIAGDTGFFLNDQMDDFAAKPGAANLFELVQGSANAIAPGKRPLSSMTPTIVLKDGAPLLVVGTPGGSRIITTVLEIIVNVIDHGMALKQAVDAPRIHNQWLPDTLAAEPSALSSGAVNELTAMGYHVVELEPWGTGNAAEVIGIAPDDPGVARSLGFPRAKRLYGASDARAPAGSAVAP
jgi:gamma-glutamyltranspeptidase/glutathione hydrolase